MCMCVVCVVCGVCVMCVCGVCLCVCGVCVRGVCFCVCVTLLYAVNYSQNSRHLLTGWAPADFQNDPWWAYIRKISSLFFSKRSSRNHNFLLRHSFVMLSYSFRLLTPETLTAIIDNLDQRIKNPSVSTCNTEISVNTVIRDVIMGLNCADNWAL